MKLRSGDPWMSAADYSRELSEAPGGLGVNLLVSDVAESVRFQTDVLGAQVLYQDEDFAALAGFGSQWCVHADHTYDKHPLRGIVAGLDGRGAGVELRVHGCDPDAAEGRARVHGFDVLAGAADKAHGLREAYLLDADGYCWVPDVPVEAAG